MQQFENTTLVQDPDSSGSPGHVNFGVIYPKSSSKITLPLYNADCFVAFFYETYCISLTEMFILFQCYKMNSPSINHSMTII